MRAINTVSLLVRDYDEAIDFFAGKLGFRLLEDTPLDNHGKRWVLMTPTAEPADSASTTPTQGARLLLALASDELQQQTVGKQGGGRVMFFLQTSDFERDHAAMQAAGVYFRESPRHESYGTVAVFEDLYGNPWDLLQAG